MEQKQTLTLAGLETRQNFEEHAVERIILNLMHADEGEYHGCTQSQLKNAVENANESEKCLEAGPLLSGSLAMEPGR